MGAHGPTLPPMTREESARRQPKQPTEKRVDANRQARADRNNIARILTGRKAGHHRLRGWEMCPCGSRRQAKNCHGRDVG